jgi:lipopolysaccharide/colanic/teichoic acid biosynthesis glycosyltransferase
VPVFYRGDVGRGGRIFTMTKFRTLRIGAESRLGHHLGVALVERTEAEVTTMGRWLRATQLDEITQFWNVLKGDMSLVGPRPIRPRLFEELAEELPAYWQRLVVRLGLTGFACGAPRLRDVDGREAAHDLEWIADRSLRLYLVRSAPRRGAWSGNYSTSRRDSSRSRSRWTRCITSSLILPSLVKGEYRTTLGVECSRLSRW